MPQTGKRTKPGGFPSRVFYFRGAPLVLIIVEKSFGVASVLRTGVKTILSRRDTRTKPGVLTPGIRPKMIRPEGVAETCCPQLVRLASYVSEDPISGVPSVSPTSRLRRAFRTWRSTQYSGTPSLRLGSFEDSDSTELAEVLSDEAQARCCQPLEVGLALVAP